MGQLPVVTSCDINPGLSSQAIDDDVKAARESGASLYGVITPRLEDMKPDLIVSQGVCDVCAVSGALIEDVVETLTPRPALVNLEPFSLADILETFRLVGDAAGVPDRAEALITDAEARIEAVRRNCEGRGAPRTVFLDWVAPPFLSGHWTHDLLRAVGATNVMPNGGAPSVETTWDAVADMRPEVLIIACCGFDEARTRAEIAALPAVQAHLKRLEAAGCRIHVTDGHHHFSSPDPRIIDSLERLAEMVHA